MAVGVGEAVGRQALGPCRRLRLLGPVVRGGGPPGELRGLQGPAVGPLVAGEGREGAPQLGRAAPAGHLVAQPVHRLVVPGAAHALTLAVPPRSTLRDAFDSRTDLMSGGTRPKDECHRPPGGAAEPWPGEGPPARSRRGSRLRAGGDGPDRSRGESIRPFGHHRCEVEPAHAPVPPTAADRHQGTTRDHQPPDHEDGRTPPRGRPPRQLVRRQVRRATRPPTPATRCAAARSPTASRPRPRTAGASPSRSSPSPASPSPGRSTTRWWSPTTRAGSCPTWPSPSRRTTTTPRGPSRCATGSSSTTARS